MHYSNDGSDIVADRCDPYSLPGCAHHTTDPKLPNCSEAVKITPDPTGCGAKQCANGKPYAASKHFAANKSHTVEGEAAMMAEIYEHGPIACSFIVMDFFVLCKRGTIAHEQLRSC